MQIFPGTHLSGRPPWTARSIGELPSSQSDAVFVSKKPHRRPDLVFHIQLPCPDTPLSLFQYARADGTEACRAKELSALTGKETCFESDEHGRRCPSQRMCHDAVGQPVTVTWVGWRSCPGRSWQPGLFHCRGARVVSKAFQPWAITLPPTERNLAASLCIPLMLSRRATLRHTTREHFMSKKAADHHKKGSEHLTHAARHHGEAAKHHEGGQHERPRTTPTPQADMPTTRDTTRRKPERPISRTTARNSLSQIVTYISGA